MNRKVKMTKITRHSTGHFSHRAWILMRILWLADPDSPPAFNASGGFRWNEKHLWCFSYLLIIPVRIFIVRTTYSLQFASQAFPWWDKEITGHGHRPLLKNSRWATSRDGVSSVRLNASLQHIEDTSYSRWIYRLGVSGDVEISNQVIFFSCAHFQL